MARLGLADDMDSVERSAAGLAAYWFSSFICIVCHGIFRLSYSSRGCATRLGALSPEPTLYSKKQMVCLKPKALTVLSH
jgi:hypothetical protein